jgi:hypothetical protein
MFGAMNRFAVQRPVIFWSFVIATAGKSHQVLISHHFPTFLA